MKILIPSIQVPFISGGAEVHINSLKRALQEHGHNVEVVKYPFKFSPNSYIVNLIDFIKEQDFNEFNGHHIDKVIALQFPSYYVKHSNKSLWIMHQHRAVYDLYKDDKSLKDLKYKIEQEDNNIFRNFQNTIYANSQNVAKRLKKYNNIEATPLYHPPANEDKFFCKDDYGYIFCPSRLEKLKRQELLIKAMQYTKSNVKVIIAGDGGQYQNYKKLIEDLNLSNKVKLVGRVSESEKYLYYARALAVFFAPYDEDYGYITLEAMLSSKAVITCFDSGGPLEFIVDNETGFILNPNPQEIAQKIDYLFFNKQIAKKLGSNALVHYKNININWNNVVSKLLGE